MAALNNNKAMKKLVLAYTAAINNRDLDALDQFFYGEYVSHGPVGEIPSLKAYKQVIQGTINAFPDVQWSAHDQVAEGDRVVSRYEMTGTHRGDFMGMPATNTHVQVTGIQIDRVANGQVVESWVVSDLLGMMTQLGVVPAPAVS